MLRYYSYYSVGGYKDMYLGNLEMKETETYFLPLLPVWKKKAIDNNDNELSAKVNYLESLPSIKILKNDDVYGFPKECGNVISHGAYKVIYYGVQSGEYVLAIRDIAGMAKDETGRSIPFLIAIVGDDKTILDKICSYIIGNMDSTEKFLSKMFRYDADKNGICFCLQDFNKWIEEISAKTLALSKVDVSNDKAFVLIPDGLNKNIAVKEQSLQNRKVKAVMLGELDAFLNEVDSKIVISKKQIAIVSLAILAIGLALIIIL